MQREALGTYKGVFEHMGVLGASGTSRGVQMHGASKHMGCQLNAHKCKTYMPLKKIRGV